MEAHIAYCITGAVRGLEAPQVTGTLSAGSIKENVVRAVGGSAELFVRLSHFSDEERRAADAAARRAFGPLLKALTLVPAGRCPADAGTCDAVRPRGGALGLAVGAWADRQLQPRRWNFLVVSRGQAACMGMVIDEGK
eukprot:gene21288-36552_t